MATAINAPVDVEARKRALALEQSFIVRAPAGSGKTELLTRRFLKLLASVDEPEEILAITFTRAATAEMRARVLQYLEMASRTDAAPNEDERVSLARAALAHSEARGWQLLEQPHRLNIETIDSLCLRIAQNQPLLSRMGGSLSPTEKAAPLYAEAARRTLGRLGRGEPELEEALIHLLDLRDNNLLDCEGLIAGMLAQRDQWIRAFPFSGEMSEQDWEAVRARLERPFRDEVRRAHAEVYRLMRSHPEVAEVFALAHYACDNGNEEAGALRGVDALPAPEEDAVEHWRCICRFLLTSDAWRKAGGLNKTFGFPCGSLEEKQKKARMGELLDELRRIPGLREALCAAREVPDARYDDEQWKTLRHIFVTLRRAVAELRVLFAERGVVDFTELGVAARLVLENSDAGTDVLLALSGNMQHLLVDEFQDTSLSQHELLCLLVRAWDESDGRTCFLVGDPMQSVYLFRQAEVELFHHVAERGLGVEGHAVELERLELRTNFRSHEGLTARWNEMFELVFTPDAHGGAGQVSYSHTVAAEPALREAAVHVHPQIIGEAGRKPSPEEKERAVVREAEQVAAIIAQHQGRIEQAIADGSEYRVAVLGRARPHLTKIASLLRERGIPFRAVDLERLSERQELIDLMSLVRALLHPMDRIAWLSVLRAPWCGLSLADLHALTGADDPACRRLPMVELIQSRISFLSEDGAARLQRVAAILKQALAVRFEGLHSGSFSQWIERTWRSLGGAECVDEDGYENAQVFFRMLDEVAPDGMACLTAEFEAEMDRLYAHPDPRVSERAGVQLMTIHKAKGLGFDVVIVPGLDRKAAHDKQPLICSLERTESATGEREMLVAPIGYRGGDKHPTYSWVQKQRTLRADEELKRLLYVACTRARESLHLLGTAMQTNSGLKPAGAKSLLSTAWLALAPDFERAQAARERARESAVIPFPARRQDLGLEIAAGAETALPRTLVLRRFRAGAEVRPRAENVAFAGRTRAEDAPPRPEGSRDARRKGSVVHALLEHASRGAKVESLRTRARLLLRGMAYSGKALEEGVAEAFGAVRNCMNDPDGAWILAPHPQAQSESSWTSWEDGALETVRADRVFIAGHAPHAPGEDHLWIVDYKMSAPAGDADFLVKQREAYSAQLERYARVLREAKGIELPVRFGLYYPRISRLDWWG
ncbi:MAG TPA: UvrD-helicase domain-containing protein [Silvibacterium sp.]|nr:UvrD-helicase domain-containing protein [Silvibacterium sp.]